MNDPSANRSNADSKSGLPLIAVAAVLLLGVFIAGKISPQVSFQPVGGGWFGAWLVGLFAAVLLGLMLLGPLRSMTSPRRRWALLALRLAAIVLVVLMMLRPVLEYRSMKQRDATIVFMIDLSESMSKFADVDTDQSRYERLKEVLLQALPDLAELAEKLTIKVYGFDADLRELIISGGKVELPDLPEGLQSSLGWALGEMLRREAGQRIIAVILMSDGKQRAVPPRNESPRRAAQRLKQMQKPLHTVVFGRTDNQSNPSDLAMVTLDVNASIHEKNVLTVHGEIRAVGYEGETVSVEIHWERDGKMERVGKQAIQLGTQGEFKINFTPQELGLHKLIARIVRRPNELDVNNNELATIVRVTKGGIAVLYLEGSIRLEARNLRRSLSSQPFQVDYLRLPFDPKKRSQMVDKFMTEGLKDNKGEKRKYDVFILGDVPAQAFLKPKTAGELELLQKRVSDGAGLIMIGGLYSFGPGDYWDTKLADVLPVVMTKLDRQDIGAPLNPLMHHLPANGVQLRPAPGAKDHPLLQITNSGDNAQLWKKLTLLNGANKLKNKGGTVLLEDAEGHPMLISSTFVSGRVLAFAGDSTWRWCSQGKEMEEAHRRFWQQIILYLANNEAGDGRLWVDVKQRTVFVGQRVDLTAGARNEAGTELEEFELTAQIIRRDENFKVLSRKELKFNRQGARGALSFETSEPGDYTVVVSGVIDGKKVTAEDRFLVVEAKQQEMLDTVPDVDSMRKLAETTGGMSISPGKFDDLIELLKKIPQNLNEEVITTSSLWDPMRRGPFASLGMPISLAAIFGFAVAALLSLEWYLRKKWGLV